MKEKTIIDMKVGERGYVRHWAIYLFENRLALIRGNYAVASFSTTEDVYIERGKDCVYLLDKTEDLRRHDYELREIGTYWHMLDNWNGLEVRAKDNKPIVFRVSVYLPFGEMVKNKNGDLPGDVIAHVLPDGTIIHMFDNRRDKQS